MVLFFNNTTSKKKGEDLDLGRSQVALVSINLTFALSLLFFVPVF